jgi:CDP-diglyceride synthetase
MVLVFNDPDGRPMSGPKQAILWAWPLCPSAIAWVRFGVTWELLEGIAVYSWWLALFFGRAGAAAWLRRHLVTALLLLVFVFATLFFAFPALFFGVVLSVWWCWALGLSAGVIVTTLLWPAQRRFWARQDG